MKKKFYITTAISYPNGPPHIGHVYEAIATDALARFKRLDGYDVHFVTGTDDHGQKIYRMAREQNVSPQEMTDQLSEKFKEMCQHFSISYDYFIRTSHKAHHHAVRDIWQKMEARGDIYKDVYKGWYAVREEEFYTESELVKDEKGAWITTSGVPVEWVEEESYFFKLSAFQERLLDYYEKHPGFIQPETRRNEVVSFVKGGLKDLSISRSSFDWGVLSPKEGHIVYVWLDALTNYLTAVGYPDMDEEKYKRYWPADLHIIGKDILRFHTVYWPAFLMSADLPIPERVFAHGMILTGEGEKMSKSLGNVIDPFELADIYGVDPFRYFLLCDIPFGDDGACGKKQIIHRLNADLANNLGNLAQRSLTMIQKDWDGKIPPKAPPLSEELGNPVFSRHFKKIREGMDMQNIAREMEIQNITRSLRIIMLFVKRSNTIFAEWEPWKLAKTDHVAQGKVLYATLEVLRCAAILLQPFMPNDTQKLLYYLGVDEDKRDFASLSDQLKEGTKLPPPAPLFPRYKKD